MKYESGFQDPYCYPGSNVLRNLAEIRDQAELDKDEAAETAARILQLWFKPIGGSFDSQHLRAIHRHIFQSIYLWAGHWRTVSLEKGSSRFCEPLFIESAVDQLLNRLRADGSLPTADMDVFANRAAFYLGELNAIHPFREGNGRTQREFIRELALSSGFDLRWFGVSGEEMQQASAAAQRGDYSGLELLARRGLRPVRRRNR